MKVLKVFGITLIILLLGILIGNLIAELNINKDVKNLFSKEYDKKIYSEEDIKDLPEPVQRYFKYVLTDGQEYINYVRLKHGGTFRMSAEQNWANINGEEYFLGREPGFVWVGKLPLFTGVDKFIDNEGSLEIRLLSALKIINERGEKIDQGEFLRWLGEAPLYPTALLPSENLSWESIDEDSARAIFKNNGEEYVVIFTFNEVGEAVQFNAKRYLNDSLEDWTGYYREYIEVDGMRVPSEIEVEWNLEEGDFSYARFSIDEIEYGVGERY